MASSLPHVRWAISRGIDISFLVPWIIRGGNTECLTCIPKTVIDMDVTKWMEIAAANGISSMIVSLYGNVARSVPLMARYIAMILHFHCRNAAISDLLSADHPVGVEALREILRSDDAEALRSVIGSGNIRSHEALIILDNDSQHVLDAILGEHPRARAELYVEIGKHLVSYPSDRVLRTLVDDFERETSLYYWTLLASFRRSESPTDELERALERIGTPLALRFVGDLR